MTVIVTSDTNNVRAQLQRDGYGPEQAALMAQFLTGQTPALHPAPPVMPAMLPASNKEMRAWARTQPGLQCPSHGRLPARIIAAYAAAH